MGATPIIRDLFIEKNGTEAADRTLPSWDLNYLRELANESDQAVSSFSEPEPSSVTPTQSQPTEGDDMSEALQQQLAAEKAAREKAENELTALKTAQAKAAAIATEKANAEFAEGLINEGKLLPKHADKVKALLNGAPVTADFAEGGESYLDALKGYLSDSPKVVDFSEAAKKGTQAADGTADYAEGTDPASIELDQKITAYMAEHKVDYNTAFARVAN